MPDRIPDALVETAAQATYERERALCPGSTSPKPYTPWPGLLESNRDYWRRNVRAALEASPLLEMFEALEAIEQLCEDEIKARFGGHPYKSIEQCARNSKIYSLLVLPQNLARHGLASFRAADVDGPR